MNTPAAGARPRLRTALLLGALAGALLCATRHELRDDLVASPSVRVPLRVLLRGQTPDAMRWATEEAARLRRGSDGAAWPPPPIRPRGASPLADEGVFLELPAAAPLALTWIRVPGTGDETLRVLAWPTDALHLAPAAARGSEVVARLPAPPPGDAADRVLARIGAPTNAAPRPALVDDTGETLALCVDGHDRAMLMWGRTRRVDAVARLLGDAGCDHPGVVWRGRGGGLRIGADASEGGGTRWVLRRPGAPALAFGP
ncbi:MAG: hypothetical protein ACQEXJ_02960 [Myxococcota bacterium]